MQSSLVYNQYIIIIGIAANATQMRGFIRDEDKIESSNESETQQPTCRDVILTL